MATNIRLRGGKTDSYTVTLNNQVGPDTATQSDRTIPSYSGNAIYVAKTGSDANAGTTEGLPKLTIQNAIDTAVSGAQAYVVIIDSGVYRENIDLKGKTLVAKDGFAPEVIAFIEADSYVTGTTTLATISTSGSLGSGQGGYYFFKWNQTGDYIFCNATGVYYSSNLTSWTLVSGSTGSVHVYPDDDGNLYSSYVSGSTYKIIKIDTSYSVTDHATLSADVGEGAVLVRALSDSSDFTLTSTYASSIYTTTGAPSGSVVSGYGKPKVYYNSGVFSFTLINDDGDAILLKYKQGTGLQSAETFSFNGSPSGALPQNGYNTFFQRADGTYLMSFGNTLYRTDGGKNLIFVGTIASVWDVFYGASYCAMPGKFNGWDLFSNTGGDVFYEQSNNYGPAHAALAEGENFYFIDITGGNTLVKSYDFTPYARVASTTATATINGVKLKNDVLAAPYVIDEDDNDIDLEWCKVESVTSGIANSSLISNSIFSCSGTAVLGNPTISNSIFDNCSVGVNIGTNAGNIQHSVFFSSSIGIYSTNGGAVSDTIKDNIFWQTGTPFGYINQTTIKDISTIDYNLYVQPSNATTVEMDTTQYTNNPLFQDENTGNFKLQSKAEGYGIDSLYLKGGSNQSSDSKDMGAWDITRTLSGTTYSDDYTLGINPTAVNVEYRTPNYSTATNANGEVSEWATEREGHVRRTFLLPYSDGSVNGNWYRQIHDLVYLYGQVGNVYEFGYTDDGGSTWKPMRNGTGTVSGSDISVAYNGEEWAVDKWAGYWILINGTHYRITSSTAKTDSGSCTFTVDGTPTTGSQAWQIDFILVTLNKKSPLAPKYAAYTEEDDYVQEVAAIGYTITLNEVDDYDI